jgi:hypothetical protein
MQFNIIWQNRGTTGRMLQPTGRMEQLERQRSRLWSATVGRRNQLSQRMAQPVLVLIDDLQFLASSSSIALASMLMIGLL